MPSQAFENPAPDAAHPNLPDGLPAELPTGPRELLGSRGRSNAQAETLLIRSNKSTRFSLGGDHNPHQHSRGGIKEESETKQYSCARGRVKAADNLTIVKGPSFKAPWSAARRDNATRLHVRIGKKRESERDVWNTAKTAEATMAVEPRGEKRRRVVSGRTTGRPRAQVVMPIPTRLTARADSENHSTPVQGQRDEDDDLLETDAEHKQIDLSSPDDRPSISISAANESTLNGERPGVTVAFLTTAGNVARSRPWSMCSTMDKLLKHAGAARIVESLKSEFVLCAKLGETEIPLAKGDADDFEELKASIGKYQAENGSTASGVVAIRLENEIRAGGD